MIDGNRLGSAGFEKLGTSYKEMDCQAFVEWCLMQCGLKMDLAGSNAWYREVLRSGWVGSPEECVKKFGKVPAGAFLFIWKNDRKEPEKYRKDGLGNASHIGLVTGKGEGAIHSSSSRGCVAESKFAGKTIRGGWNKVGLWTARVCYEGVPEDASLPVAEESGGIRREPKAEYAAVWAAQGSTVNTRQGPSIVYALSGAGRIPVGTVVQVVKKTSNWCRIRYTDPGNTDWYCWIKGEFLKPVEQNPEGMLWTVTISNLTEKKAEALRKQYPGCLVQKVER